MCGSLEACDTNVGSSKPKCKDGTCEACAANSDCPAWLPRCDTTAGTCLCGASDDMCGVDGDDKKNTCSGTGMTDKCVCGSESDPCATGLCLNSAMVPTNQKGDSTQTCQACTTASGDGLTATPHAGCTALNPNCVEGTCTCGTETSTLCDTKSSVCDGSDIASQACKCGAVDECGGADAEKTFCDNKGDTDDSNDACLCSKDTTTPEKGDGTTQGSCTDSANKCHGDGNCAVCEANIAVIVSNPNGRNWASSGCQGEADAKHVCASGSCVACSGGTGGTTQGTCSTVEDATIGTPDTNLICHSDGTADNGLKGCSVCQDNIVIQPAGLAHSGCTTDTMPICEAGDDSTAPACAACTATGSDTCGDGKAETAIALGTCNAGACECAVAAGGTDTGCPSENPSCTAATTCQCMGTSTASTCTLGETCDTGMDQGDCS